MNQIYDPSSLQFFHCLAGLRVNCDMVIENSPVQRRIWPFSSSWIHRVSRQLEHQQKQLAECFVVEKSWKVFPKSQPIISMSLCLWFLVDSGGDDMFKVMSGLAWSCQCPVGGSDEKLARFSIRHPISMLLVTLWLSSAMPWQVYNSFFLGGGLSASEFWEDWSQLWAVVKGQSYHIALCDD